MKKVIIWSSSILAVIILLITLTFTVFTLKSATLTFHNATTLFAEEQTKNDIIEKANFKYGHTVLFMDKQGYVNSLEKEFPYLEVINIETVFPNKFNLHCNEREELFAIEYADGHYICDADLKILKTEQSFENSQNNPILLTTYQAPTNTFSAGDFLDVPEINILKNISPSFELTNRNISKQMALIKSIKIINTIDLNNALSKTNYGLEITTFNDIKTIITVANEKLQYKINMFCAILSQDINPTTHYFYIYENSNGNIEAVKKQINN